MDTYAKVKLIAEDHSKSVWTRVDELLELDVNLYTNLGIDSHPNEKEEVSKQSRAIYKAIRDLDKMIGDSFLNHLDK
jgi:hypothetical protein